MMNGDQLAQEILIAIGGVTNKQRRKAFEKLANAIVLHIQTQGVVNVATTCPAGGGTGTGTVT